MSEVPLRKTGWDLVHPVSEWMLAIAKNYLYALGRLFRAGTTKTPLYDKLAIFLVTVLPNLRDRIALILVSVIWLWGGVHVVRTRTLSDLVSYSLYFSAVAGSIALILLIGLWWRLRSKLGSSGLIFLLGFVGVAVLVAPMYYVLAATLKDLYLWVQSPALSATETIFASVMVTTLLGTALFYFRLRLRACFGVTEALAGIIAAAHRVATDFRVTEPIFYLAVLTAGIYLVVRGLDNVHQGLTKEPTDPLATKIFQVFRDEIFLGRFEQKRSGARARRLTAKQRAKSPAAKFTNRVAVVRRQRTK